MMLNFGIGYLFGQRTDVTNVGPDNFGVLQDNSIEFSFESKELYSQLQFPIDVARGKGKVTGKAKLARIFGALYADLFFGTTLSTGENNVSVNEAHTAAATVTVTNSTSYLGDLGVYFTSAANLRMNYTTGALSSGSYATNNSGVYSFFSGDFGKGIAISYVYTDAGGKTITLTNNIMGYTPTWQGTFYANHNTQGASGSMTLLLNQCVSDKLSFPTKIDGYTEMDFDYKAFSNAAGSLGSFSVTE
jgi:hypothetical protein